MKLIASTMTIGFEQAARETDDRLVDHGGLVGDAVDVDADRQFAT